MPRNVGMIATSLQRVGAARSIVIDEDNEVMAGNATVEAAGQAGIERIRIVEADGNELIAVRRRGLTPEQKAFLKLSDNRTAELAGWEEPVVAAMLDEFPDIKADLFYDDELNAILAQMGAVPVVPEASDPLSPSLKSEAFIEISCTVADLEAFRPMLAEWSLRDGVTINIS